MTKTIQLFLLLTIVLMSGCATTTDSEKVNKIHTLEIDQSFQVFEFSKQAFQTSKKGKQVIADENEGEFFRELITKEMRDKSAVYGMKKFNTNYGEIVEQGMEVVVMGNGNINVAYSSKGENYIDGIFSLFKVNFTETADHYKLNLKCPTIVNEYASARGPNPERPFKLSAIKKDIQRLCTKLTPVINDYAIVKGRFSSQKSPDLIRADFDRAFGVVSKKELGKKMRQNRKMLDLFQSDMKKTESTYYELTTPEKDDRHQALVVFAPVDGGTKVNYHMLYDYKIQGNGETTYSLKELKAIENHLQSVAD